MTGGELLRRGTAVLRQAGLEQPRLEAEVLLAHAWGRSREELLIHPEQEVPEAAARQFLALAGQRAGGVPAAYLTSAREFMSLLMAVTPAVLIPRPETEVLVEEVLRWLASRTTGACYSGRGTVFDQPLVADVGTGSGAIAVSLARYHLAVQVTAIDISEAALEVAAVNAARHGLADRISFLAGDLLAPLLARGCRGRDGSGGQPALYPHRSMGQAAPGGAAGTAPGPGRGRRRPRPVPAPAAPGRCLAGPGRPAGLRDRPRAGGGADPAPAAGQLAAGPPDQGLPGRGACGDGAAP